MAYKEYTNDQYVAFLKHDLGSDFGFTESEFLDMYMKLNFSAIAPMTTYKVTRKQLEDDYIPLLNSIMGGYVFFLLYSYAEGGGAGNWVNHYAADTNSTPYGCMRTDAKYLVGLSTKRSVPAMSDPYGGYDQPYTEDTPGETARVLRSMPSGSIGRVYIPSTMAGNAWVWGTAWAEKNWGSGKYGNPYDTLIDLIKSAGHDPFSTSTSTSTSTHVHGGDYQPQNPQSTKPKVVKSHGAHQSYIYPSGSLFASANGDGIIFTKFGESLFMEPAGQKVASASSPVHGDAKDSGKESDKIPSETKWDLINKEIDRVKSAHGGIYTYYGVRPQPNPIVSGYADCSGMIGFVIRNVYPQVWNSGYVNTGTIYRDFKEMGKVVWAGPVSELPAHYDQVKKGYIIELGQDMTFGSGLLSHTGIMLGDGPDSIFFNQSGGSASSPTTLWDRTLRQEVAMVGGEHPYWAILKI